uniref:Uncharacterized protein n=1 Tax=Spermophilus dauricus TaxID=99837 RepID=A0A8C9UIT1_SPEDA
PEELPLTFPGHSCLGAAGLRLAALEVTRATLQHLLQVDIEQLDPRGRTPLHLATTLGHLECARVLLAHGADVGRENRSGWTGGHWSDILYGCMDIHTHAQVHTHLHAFNPDHNPFRQVLLLSPSYKCFLSPFHSIPFNLCNSMK